MASYTAEEIQANRKKYLAALRRYRGQCQGDMFQGRKACAVGVGVRIFLGIHNEREYNAAVDADPYGNFEPYGEIADRLGISGTFGSYLNGTFGVDDLWKMNDRDDGMTFVQIADKLAEMWDL